MVIDIMGRQVDLIERGYRDEGLHEVAWQPENLAGGLYLVHLEVEGQVSSRMMIYLK